MNITSATFKALSIMVFIFNIWGTSHAKGLGRKRENSILNSRLKGFCLKKGSTYYTYLDNLILDLDKISFLLCTFHVLE